MQESALRRGLFVLIVGEALGGARFGIGNKGSRLFYIQRQFTIPFL